MQILAGKAWQVRPEVSLGERRGFTRQQSARKHAVGRDADCELAQCRQYAVFYIDISLSDTSRRLQKWLRHHTAGIATASPAAVVTSASARPEATNALAGVFLHGNPSKRSKNTKHGAKKSDERGGGGDCGESAKAESQFCSKLLAMALKGAFGGVNSFPVCELRRRGSERGQTGGDYARNVAEAIAFGDLGDFSEISFSQCGCGVANKSMGLLAGSL